MVFSSITFLCVFLPVVFVLYCIIPSLKVRNVLLIIFSILFYSVGEPVYVFLMLGSALVNYIFGRILKNHNAHSRVWLIAAIIINLGILGLFKYADFIIENINHVFSLNIQALNISLPIGISFFTFQAMSYVIDVYNDPELSQKKFGNILLYISFFPQLIAGPIIKYHDIQSEIENRKQSLEEISSGISIFIIGLSKKVLISNVLALTVDTIYMLDTGEINILIAWLAAISYMLQIYYDFSGYSDMAIGLARIFGFHFKENFNYPYFADSIRDFWVRWHISLSTWFKEYLYIPLKGNRKGNLRTILNTYIVFFTTGLWHGASWTFVLWGLWHGTFSVLEKQKYFIHKIKYKCIRRIYTWIIVVVGFVMFRADTVGQGFKLIIKMFAGFQFTESTKSILYMQLTPLFITVMVIGLIFAFPVKQWFENLIINKDIKKLYFKRIGYAVTIVLLILNIMSLSSNTYNPFIYFRF